MRKRFWIPLALVGVTAVGFFGFAPAYVESSMNQIDGKPLIKVSDEAKALHSTLTIVDLHSDSLMWNRDIIVERDRTGSYGLAASPSTEMWRFSFSPR